MYEIKKERIVKFDFASDFPGSVLASGKYRTQHEIKNK